MRKGGRVV